MCEFEPVYQPMSTGISAYYSFIKKIKIFLNKHNSVEE